MIYHRKLSDAVSRNNCGFLIQISVTCVTLSDWQHEFVANKFQRYTLQIYEGKSKIIYTFATASFEGCRKMASIFREHILSNISKTITMLKL